jgi:uncharacterized protein YjbJ (UPF0337 family)
MNQSTKDDITGNLHEVKGTIKEKVGQVTNNPDLEARGKAEHNKGVIEKDWADRESGRKVSSVGSVAAHLLERHSSRRERC